MRRKVTVVGAGNVGATAAQEIARRDYADVVLVDIKEGLPQGKALDIDQAASVLGYEPSVVGSNGYGETKGSDVVVITAGVPRTGDMSRDDLVSVNEGIVGSVTREVVEHSPDAILIIVSNPLDAMCHVAKNVSGWPRERARPLPRSTGSPRSRCKSGETSASQPPPSGIGSRRASFWRRRSREAGSIEGPACYFLLA